MDLLVSPGRRLRGKCRVPGDKSISHRAALIGALAEGTTAIKNFLPGDDCLSTLRCLNALGVEIQRQDDLILVVGSGLHGLREPGDVLNAGNSGTTMRLLLGVLAGQNLFAVLTGDASLRQRPMGRVIKPLARMGVQIRGRAGDSYAPLAVRGTSDIIPLVYRLPVSSAQVKSAILLAGLGARGVTSVWQPSPSRDHTERMLKSFGASIELDGLTVHLEGGKRLQGRDVHVPGDISAAAFLIVAASILPDCEILLQDVGVNPTRTGILDVLGMMGARIGIMNLRDWNGEPVADLQVQSADLRGAVIEGDLLPRVIDEIPVLAVAAVTAAGQTEIREAAELRVKETDRLKAITVELGKMGGQVDERPDGLVIQGGQHLQGARVNSWGDHRIAMALAVAGLLAKGGTVIENVCCIDISFPGFAELFNHLGAAMYLEN